MNPKILPPTYHPRAVSDWILVEEVTVAALTAILISFFGAEA